MDDGSDLRAEDLAALAKRAKVAKVDLSRVEAPFHSYVVRGARLAVALSLCLKGLGAKESDIEDFLRDLLEKTE